VKVIQADKIEALQYRGSVIREMAILQLLNHPGIARMVSAFRYKESAYLALEYASRGDLHSFLLGYGKLEHKYCR
jgi:serine/threonine protein kinase